MNIFVCLLLLLDNNTDEEEETERPAYGAQGPPPSLSYPSQNIDHSSLQLQLQWDFTVVDREAFFLGQTKRAREKYLLFTSTKVQGMAEHGIPLLGWLWKRYFPASQPRAIEEEAYQCYMWECLSSPGRTEGIPFVNLLSLFLSVRVYDYVCLIILFSDGKSSFSWTPCINWWHVLIFLYSLISNLDSLLT